MSSSEHLANLLEIFNISISLVISIRSDHFCDVALIIHARSIAFSHQTSSQLHDLFIFNCLPISTLVQRIIIKTIIRFTLRIWITRDSFLAHKRRDQHLVQRESILRIVQIHRGCGRAALFGVCAPWLQGLGGVLIWIREEVIQVYLEFLYSWFKCFYLRWLLLWSLIPYIHFWVVLFLSVEGIFFYGGVYGGALACLRLLKRCGF